MKKIIISLFIIFLSVSLSPVCFATEDINYYQQQYNLSEADKLDDILDQETKEELNTLGINLQESNLNLNFNSLLSFIYKKILFLATTPLKIFAVLLTVIVLNSVVTSITNNESKDILSFISSVFVCLTVINPLLELVERTNDALTLCSSFIVVLAPIYASILLSCGFANTSSLANIVFISGQTTNIITHKILLPLINIYIAFSISNSIFKNEFSNSISSTIKKYFTWALGIIATVYTAIVSLAGVIAGTNDSLAQRTAKFFVSSTLPVIGGVFSESFNLFTGALITLKNGVGIYGMAVILVILLPIILEAFILKCVLSSSAFISDALSDSNVSLLLRSLSEGIGFLISICICVFVIYTVSLYVLMLGGKG